MQNPVFVEAEVQALIYENLSEKDVIIYSDGSVGRLAQSSWAFTAQVAGQTVPEHSGAFHHHTNSMTMEVMTLTKALAFSSNYGLRHRLSQMHVFSVTL
jgi:ribonuclease HI